MTLWSALGLIPHTRQLGRTSGRAGHLPQVATNRPRRKSVQQASRQEVPKGACSRPAHSTGHPRPAPIPAWLPQSSDAARQLRPSPERRSPHARRGPLRPTADPGPAPRPRGLAWAPPPDRDPELGAPLTMEVARVGHHGGEVLELVQRGLHPLALHGGARHDETRTAAATGVCRPRMPRAPGPIGAAGGEPAPETGRLGTRTRPWRRAAQRGDAGPRVPPAS